MYKKNKFKGRIVVFTLIFVSLALSSFFINKNFNLSDFFLKDIMLSINEFFRKPFNSFCVSSEYSFDDDRIKYYESENAELVSEISKLKKGIEQEGKTLVPLKLYFSKNRAKILLALCKGKKNFDKREVIKERDLNREKAKLHKYNYH